MIIESSFEQGSPEWHKARTGNPGATGFSSIITSTGKPSKQREKYLYQIAEERIEGSKPDTFQSYYMLRGTQLEPEARELFEMLQNVSVTQCAMVYPDERKEYHISPDGLIPELERGLEIKCPALQTHDKYLTGGVLPTEYRLQVQGSLMVTGYDVWWFMSYFPGVKPFIIPVERDENLISILRDEMESFIEDLHALIGRLAA